MNVQTVVADFEDGAVTERCSAVFEFFPLTFFKPIFSFRLKADAGGPGVYHKGGWKLVGCNLRIVGRTHGGPRKVAS